MFGQVGSPSLGPTAAMYRFAFILGVVTCATACGPFPSEIMVGTRTLPRSEAWTDGALQRALYTYAPVGPRDRALRVEFAAGALAEGQRAHALSGTLSGIRPQRGSQFFDTTTTRIVQGCELLYDRDRTWQAWHVVELTEERVMVATAVVREVQGMPTCRQDDLAEPWLLHRTVFPGGPESYVSPWARAQRAAVPEGFRP